MKIPSLLVLSFAGAISSHLAAADGGSGTLLVTNKGDRTLSIVDPATLKQIATVPEEGVTGHEIIASADGQRVFVPIYGDAGVGQKGSDGQLIRAIDLGQQKIVGTIDFGKGVRPHCPMLNPRDGLLYVTTELENTISIIDPATLTIVGSIPTGQAESHMLALSHDGKRGYTANVASGTVSFLDLEKRELTGTVPVAKHIQRICVSPDDRWIFTADQVQPRMVVLDAAAAKVVKTIDLPDYGYGAAVTPDGKSLVVAIPNTKEVALIDLEAGKMVSTVSVPKSPQEVLIRPDGAVAYVSCDASKEVAAIDLKDWKVQGLIEVGKTADGLAWAAAK